MPGIFDMCIGKGRLARFSPAAPSPAVTGERLGGAIAKEEPDSD